jgi:hypothetical protein
MRHARPLATALVASLLVALSCVARLPWPAPAASPAAAAPAAGAEGQMTWAVHISLAPTWFDPAEAPGIITPFMIYYALHDALVKPMPGQRMAPSLAESWKVSDDQRTYEFILRSGVKFHNGDPFTADDVKFSFERAKGAQLHEKVKEVVVVDTPSQSGKGQKIARCPTCRIAVWSNYAGAGDAVRFVRVGTLDEPDRLPPDVHIFTASKQPWVVIPSGMPAVPEYYQRDEHWPAESIARGDIVRAKVKAFLAAARPPG